MSNMYNSPQMYSCPFSTLYSSENMYNFYKMYPSPYFSNPSMYITKFPKQSPNQYIHREESGMLINLKDYGPEPFVININAATKQNNTFRTALWSGTHLQLTLMSLKVGEDIGLEVHPNLDQFLRIEQGQGLVQMGDSRDNLNFQRNVYDDFAFIIPAGKWHNLINTGNKPLKLYSIYAPPQHPHGTVHETKEDAEASE